MATTMQDIERLLQRLGAARDKLAAAAIAQDEEITAVQRSHAAAIRAATRKFQAAHAAAAAAVGEAPELFARPRSVVLYGIAAGWRKGKGKIEWEDDDEVVARIERHFPDQADEFVKTEKTPVKGALNDLSAHDLRRLGIEVEETDDVPFVRLAEKEAARLIRALLRKAAKSPEEAEA